MYKRVLLLLLVIVFCLAGVVELSPVYGGSAGDKRLAQVKQWAEDVPQSNPQLLEALRDKDSRVSKLAQWTLSRQGDAVIPFLVDALAGLERDYGLGCYLCGDKPTCSPKDLGQSVSSTLWLTLVNTCSSEKFADKVKELLSHKNERVRLTALGAAAWVRREGALEKIKKIRASLLTGLLDDPSQKVKARAFSELARYVKGDEDLQKLYEKHMDSTEADTRRAVLKGLPRYHKLAGRYEKVLGTLLSYAKSTDEDLKESAAEFLSSFYDPSKNEINEKHLLPLRKKLKSCFQANDLSALSVFCALPHFMRKHPLTRKESWALRRALVNADPAEMRNVAPLLGCFLHKSVARPVWARSFLLLLKCVSQKRDDALAVLAAYELRRYATSEKPARGLWERSIREAVAERLDGWTPPDDWKVSMWGRVYRLHAEYLGPKKAVDFLVKFQKYMITLPEGHSTLRERISYVSYAKHAMKNLRDDPRVWKVFFEYLTGGHKGTRDSFAVVCRDYLRDPEFKHKDELMDFFLKVLPDEEEHQRFRAAVIQCLKECGYAPEKVLPVVKKLVCPGTETNLLGKSLIYLARYKKHDKSITREYVLEQAKWIFKDEEIAGWTYQNVVAAYTYLNLPEKEYVDQLIRWLETIPLPSRMGEYRPATTRINWSVMPISDPRSYVLYFLEEKTGKKFGDDIKAWRKWYEETHK